jgi:YidC/Oxa1 family membrane protein insertase
MVTLLQPLMLVEEWILEALHSIGLSWGLAIVGLTLLVRLSLLPLAVRQAGASRRRTEHAPQIRALRELHGDDAATLGAELRGYRKRHGLGMRGAVIGIAIQVIVVWSLALVLRGDAVGGTFGDAGWLFIPDLSEPASGGALALLLAGWLAVRLASLGLGAKVGPRRVAITLLAPIPLLFAAAHIPSGILVYLIVSAGFGLVQKLALRARMPGLAASPVSA